MNSNPRSSELRRWLYGWFGSYFGVATTVLLAHAIAAQWAAVSEVWTIVAWLLLGVHVLSVLFTFLLLWMLVGAVLPFGANNRPNSVDNRK
jgi:hypothetical protein